MKNKTLIIFVISFFVVVAIAAYILTTTQKPKLELEKVDAFLGVTESKIYATIGSKLITKTLDGKSYEVLASDVDEASLDAVNNRLFYTQIESDKKKGVILSLKTGEKTEYSDATEAVWVESNPVLKVRKVDKNKRADLSLVSSSNKTISLPLYIHDTAVSLGNNLAVIMEVGSETDESSSVIIDKYDPQTFNKIDSKDFNGMTTLQNVGDKVIYEKDNNQYQLSENLVETNIKNPQLNRDLMMSPTKEILSLDTSKAVAVWSLKDSGFEKTGTINADVKDPIVLKAENVIYSKNSHKIFFFAGGNIYSYNYRGKV